MIFSSGVQEWLNMSFKVQLVLSVISQTIKLLQMGNKQSKSYKPPSFKRENWHLIPSHRSSHRPEHGLSYLYRNNLTSQEVEQYQIYFHNEAEYEKYLEFFEWREREDTIVNTKFINTQETRQFCNTNHNARIYIEHVPVRLSDIQDIPYPENLYVLFRSLDGFEKLFHFVGYFHPEQDFICIDRDGRIKVWLNSDLSKCHTVGSQFSDQTSHFRDSEQYQQQMVTEIIQMIQKNTAEDIQATMTFTQHLWKNGKQKLNFKQGKQEIISYAKHNRTEIPNYFESVLNIFNQDKPSQLDGSVLRHEQAHSLKQHRRSSRINLQPKSLTSTQPNQQIANLIPQANKAVANFPNKAMPYDKTNSQNLFRPPSQNISSSFHRQNHQVRPHSPVLQLTQPQMTQSSFYPQIKFNYRGSGYGLGGTFMHGSVGPNQYQNPINTHFSTVLHSAASSYTKTQQKIPSTTPLIPSTAVTQTQALSQVNSAVKDVIRTKKLLYSDTTETYELDQQIVKDIIKYFG